MIYIKNFENCKEFNQIFGITKHGNGAESRKNKILLACLKDRESHKWWRNFRDDIIEKGADKARVLEFDLLHAKSMDDLKGFAKFLLNFAVCADALWNDVSIPNKQKFGDGFPWVLFSPTFALDEYKGLCLDGDAKSIRYINTERDNKVFKMKAGKFITKCIESNRVTRRMPEQLKRWIGEEFAREWQSYAESHAFCKRYTLHVDDNFSDIYDSDRCLGSFGSCMTDKDYWRFYADSIDCKAAYLTDVDDNIVARCIVYSDVMDEDGNHYRLAERQYSTNQDDALKQVLVDMLIKAGEIDGYKRIGASCHDNKNFVRNDGFSMHDLTLRIENRLGFGEPLSYQDSFVYYNKARGVAYNSAAPYYDFELNTTDGILAGGHWSEYYDCYINENDSAYDDYYEDWFYSGNRADAIFRGCRIDINEERAREDEDLWVWSGHEGAYIHEDEACYVEEEGDYYTEDDCVEDVNGDWQLKESCVFTVYYDSDGGYILESDAVWSDCLEDYILESDAVWSTYDNDYTHEDAAYYSEITNRDYCSEKSMLADEAEFRKEHALVLIA